MARTVRGLEWVAADEIASALPAHAITMGPREVRFRLREPVAAHPRLSCVDDVFVLAGVLDEVGRTRDAVERLAERVSRLDLTRAVDAVRLLRSVPGHPRFDVVASLSGRNYTRFELEDDVGRALAPQLGGVFVSRSDGAAACEVDLTIRLFLDGATATAAVRLGRRPSHRREWKQRTGPGTLHPPVAAAMARLANMHVGEVAADPFCGDGTIPIELAAVRPSLSPPPGGTCGAALAPPRLLAADLDPARLRNAQANARLAGADVGFAVADAGRLPWSAGSVDALVTNPPWGVAVSASGTLAPALEEFWRCAAALLSPQGRMVLIAQADPAPLVGAHGFRALLCQRLRLAGRPSTVVLLAGPSSSAGLPAGLARWRDHAISAGVVTADGF